MKKVENNDLDFLKELIKNYVKNVNKSKLSLEDYPIVENSVIGSYANRKKEIVNLKDLHRAFKDLGYKVIH